MLLGLGAYTIRISKEYWKRNGGEDSKEEWTWGEGYREKERTERKREACEETFIRYGTQNWKLKCSPFGKQRMLS
jgi:hypothetical protein